MSEVKDRLLAGIQAVIRVQGIQEELAKEERRSPAPPPEAETGQSSHPTEENPSKSDAVEPSEPS